jgi:xanthine dehydrogenase small subunit
MSLFAAWCNGEGLAPAEIDTTLAGNLCRCTGYRPIVDAAASLEVRAIPPEFRAPAPRDRGQPDGRHRA